MPLHDWCAESCDGRVMLREASATVMTDTGRPLLTLQMHRYAQLEANTPIKSTEWETQT